MPENRIPLNTFSMKKVRDFGRGLVAKQKSWLQWVGTKLKGAEQKKGDFTGQFKKLNAQMNTSKRHLVVFIEYLEFGTSMRRPS